MASRFNTDDTIVAIATPPGRGGIGVVRLSGPDAARIGAEISDVHAPLTPRHATLARVCGSNGAHDQAVMTYFASPHSYTGEDVVEISAHGSPLLLRAIVSASMEAGARLAAPGEFTFRAFLAGRIDLVQAEAVRDLVDAVTPLQARAAFDQLEGTLTTAIREIDARLFDLTARLEASLDFPDEGYHFVDAQGAAREIDALIAMLAALLRDAARGRLVREGGHVVIAGRPNSGKSSLFNALAGAGRAIVTDLPGTTRDLLTEVVEIEGAPVTLVDTAGVRAAPADAIEAEGIARARAARAVAELLVVVLDRSRPLDDDDRLLLSEAEASRAVIVANKIDLPAAWEPRVEAPGGVLVSATLGQGIDDVRRAIALRLCGGEALRDAPAITNLRHVELLARAREALARARNAASSKTPEEFVLTDLNDARAALEEVTGARTADDTLAAIFDKFCIGK
jgi:tRNA modification GTPase